MKRIYKLDGLRGLFALFVVLFHLNKNNAPGWLVESFFVRESHIFVDFFFILSGFVISTSYDNKIQTARNLLNFIVKRLIRLYPLLLFSTGMYWYFVHPQLNPKNVLLALDTILLTNATPILGSSLGMNYPSWSISSEMISYLVFGICSLIALQNKKHWLIATITFFGISFLAYQGNYFVNGDYGFIRGLICFNLGYFIYVFSKRDFKLPNSIEWLSIIAILSLMYYYHQLVLSNTPYLFLIQLAFPLLFMSCILIFTKTNGMWSRIAQTRPLLFLGKLSYSVYLNHAFVIGYFIPKLFRWISIPNNDVKKTTCLILLLILLLAYSWCTHNIIEMKLGKRLNNFFKTNAPSYPSAPPTQAW
jgi:peptidoglycan/LPS O-acetylase OafA/YrhL